MALGIKPELLSSFSVEGGMFRIEWSKGDLGLVHPSLVSHLPEKRQRRKVGEGEGNAIAGQKEGTKNRGKKQPAKAGGKKIASAKRLGKKPAKAGLKKNVVRGAFKKQVAIKDGLVNMGGK